jgi:hypothetical protein
MVRDLCLGYDECEVLERSQQRYGQLLLAVGRTIDSICPPLPRPEELSPPFCSPINFTLLFSTR